MKVFMPAACAAALLSLSVLALMPMIGKGSSSDEKTNDQTWF